MPPHTQGGNQIMRMKLLAAVAVAAASVAMISPASAAAPDHSGTTYYGDIGYANATDSGANIGMITGTLGARIGKYWGGEFELSTGLNSSNATVSGIPVKLKMNEEGSLYLVGFAPVAPNADLFAKIGFGGTSVTASVPGLSVSGEDRSVNYGAGGQFFFDAHNGLRAEYVYHSVTGGDPSISTFRITYVRNF